ncbi:MAG: NAD(+) diphosphatase [Kofleriaceae bacterium]
MTFLPATTTTDRHGRLYAITGHDLCVTSESGIPHGPCADDALMLGTIDGTPCFAWALSPGEPLPAGTTAVPLRQLFGVISDEEFGIAGRALGLTTWDRDHRFCGRCGAATARSTRERVRTCTACEHTAYPRISPAVIVRVERDGKILLARNARTHLPFYSVLAGFVEVGESLEETVAREIHEEAGIQLADIRYFGSQPWPLTGSLMIGFVAQWAAGELAADETEILDAGWFAPDALPRLPGRLSIARALVDDFVRGSGLEPLP